jgi:exodeoxyribonuclease VII large subunit
VVRDRTWTVSTLLREINTLLEQGFSGIAVEGEVTNASRSGRGHLYFTLKDADAQLDCAMWASRAVRLKFELEDGLAVRAVGSVSIYAPRGRFQLVVDSLEPQGVGALQLAFEQLKRRLEGEGLFAAERKRPLPALPQRVGIVTSPSGAALRDMLAVLQTVDHLEVVVSPTRVQGDGAADEVATALHRIAASGLVDVIVVTRGGGSLEDLWAFNEEVVARAIAACPLPVVSAVGHETDITIADFVADVRVPTPTRAAELLAGRVEEQVRRLELAVAGLERDLGRHLALARTRLRGLEGSSGLARVPQRVRLLATRLERADRLPRLLADLVSRARQRLDGADAGLRRLPSRVAAGGHRRLVASRQGQLGQIMRARLDRARRAIDAGERALGHLSPRQVLERGYSITRVEGSREPLREADRVRGGDTLVTTLARGEVRSLVAGRGTPAAERGGSGEHQPSLFDEEDRS